MTVRNSATNAVSTVAAIAVEAAIGGARGSVAGLAVQPVVWVVTDTVPDAGDAFTYVATGIGGLVSLGWAVPGIVTGVIKAAVDDHTQTLVDEAKQDEPGHVRAGMYPLGDYSFWASGGHIQAMTIATAGGVVWQHPNGAYIFVKDANDLLVCDYRPQRSQRIYRPLLPLQRAGNGVRWTSR